MSGELALIHARMKVIEKMVTNIGYRDKFAAGSNANVSELPSARVASLSRSVGSYE